MWKRLASIALVVAALAACTDRQTPTDETNSNPEAVNKSNGAQDGLFTIVPSPRLNAEQQARLTLIRNRSSSAEVNVGLLRAAPALVLQVGRSVGIDVGANIRFVAAGKRAVRNNNGTLSWAGSTDGVFGSVQLVLTEKGVTGTLRAGGSLYRFEPIGGGLHALVRVGTFPSEHSPLSEPGDPPQGSAPILRGPTATASATVRIDVLVVYTAAAANAAGDIEGLIQLAVDESNTSYVNSGIVLTVARVHSAQVNYNEAGRTYQQHVSALQATSDGSMDDVHALRNQYRGDVVVLMVNDAEACGIAYQIYANQATAFAVVDQSCATGNYSFAHEIGHLHGARHDFPVDGTFSYRHGYVDPNDQWRTIMAYPNECGGCVRVQYWSNPDVLYPPTGQPMGNATWANNARVLEETKITLANFRKWLSASLAGPTYVGHYDTCQWTATVTNGTPPYSYSWYASWESSSTGYFFNSPGAANTTAWGYYYGSYPNPTTINVYVSGSDASGEYYSLQRSVNLQNSPFGCY